MKCAVSMCGAARWCICLSVSSSLAKLDCRLGSPVALEILFFKKDAPVTRSWKVMPAPPPPPPEEALPSMEKGPCALAFPSLPLLLYVGPSAFIIRLFVSSVLQHLVLEHLLCTRHCFRCWASNCEQETKSLPSQSLPSSG